MSLYLPVWIAVWVGAIVVEFVLVIGTAGMNSIMFRALLLPAPVGASFAFVSAAMPHSGEYQFPAILAVGFGLARGIVEWEAVRNLSLAVICTWPLIAWLLNHISRDGPDRS